MSRWPSVFARAKQFDARSIPGLALWLDAADSRTLFQDSVATIPATATNDPVGAWLDKSGNGLHVSQATDTRRPSLAPVAGKMAVDFDGAGDFLERPAFTGSVRTVLTAHVLDVVNASQVLYSIRNAAPNGLAMLVSASGDYRAAVRDTIESFFASGFVATPGVARVTHHTFTGSSDPVTPVDVAVDGVPLQQSTTSSFGNNQSILLGCRLASASVYDVALNGKLCEVIAYDRVLSAAEIASVRRHLAAKWGIALAPQASNADAQGWVNRVYQNGGTVSTSTAAAVNAFCNAIDAAGIRDRFFRLNLFAGTGLNACLVPLYRGPSLGGTQYGGVTDTNVNFVSGDYVETVGLNANGEEGATVKHLDTGVIAASLPTLATGHLGVWRAAYSSQGTTAAMIGSRNTSQVYGVRSNGSSRIEGQWGGAWTLSALQYTASGLYLASRTSFTRVDVYKDTQSIASSTSVESPSAFDGSVVVFSTRTSSTTVTVGGFPGTIHCYTIGAALSSAQVGDFHSALRTLMLALGRNV